MPRSLTISILLTIAVVVWVLSGSGLHANSSSELESEKSQSNSLNRPKFKVTVAPSQSHQIDDILQLKGQIVAARELELKAEVSGSVIRLGAEKGDSLPRNKVIVSLDLNDRAARLEKAKAVLALSKVNKESGKKLQRKKLLSALQQQQNETELTSAIADVKQIEIEIRKTSISAPFESVLDELLVEIGDFVSSGDPIAVLVDDSKIKISADVPQQHISKVNIGQEVEALLLDGTTIRGSVNYISRSANTSTRTFRVEALASNDDNKVKHFGQSARVIVKLGQLQAHKVSPSLLDLDSDGNLLVKSVTEQNKVQANQVSIIRSDDDGLWLSGLPETISLVTVGQGFVSDGDEVDTLGSEISADSEQAKAAPVK